MTKEKKYETRDDGGNINFTGEHQLDDTEDINMVNTNDSDGRSILENQDGINRTNASDSDGRSILQIQDGGQYQGQHTASSWAHNNQTRTVLLPGSVVYNFPSFSGKTNTYFFTDKYVLGALLSSSVNTVSSSREPECLLICFLLFYCNNGVNLHQHVSASF